MDVQAGGDVIIPRGEARFAALTLQGLADGMMEASILIVYEQRFRPEEKRHRPWTDYQGEKVARALSVLEAAPPAIGPISVISRSPARSATEISVSRGTGAPAIPVLLPGWMNSPPKCRPLPRPRQPIRRLPDPDQANKKPGPLPELHDRIVLTDQNFKPTPARTEWDLRSTSPEPLSRVKVLLSYSV